MRDDTQPAAAPALNSTPGNGGTPVSEAKGEGGNSLPRGIRDFPPLVMAAGGDVLTLKWSADGLHLFIQSDNHLENIVIALPAQAVPWVNWALGKLLLQRLDV
jgi:hypothetical protein